MLFWCGTLVRANKRYCNDKNITYVITLGTLGIFPDQVRLSVAHNFIAAPRKVRFRNARDLKRERQPRRSPNQPQGRPSRARKKNNEHPTM